MIDTNEIKNVRIVAPEKYWEVICSEEVEAIRAAIAPTRAFIDHVGSTAVAGLESKPVIDLLVSLSDWNEARAFSDQIASYPAAVK